MHCDLDYGPQDRPQGIITTPNSVLLPDAGGSLSNVLDSSYHYPVLHILAVEGNVGPYILRIFLTIADLAFLRKEKVASTLAHERGDFGSLILGLNRIFGNAESKANVERFSSARPAAGMLIPVYRVVTALHRLE